MLKFFSPGAPGRAPRARLGLEQLNDRWTPAVTITLAGEGVGNGWYEFTGHITGPVQSGISIQFGGVSSLAGKTAVTADDGSFDLIVQVRTDGSDDGTVTARTNVMGEDSNIAVWDITTT